MGTVKKNIIIKVAFRSFLQPHYLQRSRSKIKQRNISATHWEGGFFSLKYRFKLKRKKKEKSTLKAARAK